MLFSKTDSQLDMIDPPTQENCPINQHEAALVVPQVAFHLSE